MLLLDAEMGTLAQRQAICAAATTRRLLERQREPPHRCNDTQVTPTFDQAGCTDAGRRPWLAPGHRGGSIWAPTAGRLARPHG